MLRFLLTCRNHLMYFRFFDYHLHCLFLETMTPFPRLIITFGNVSVWITWIVILASSTNTTYVIFIVGNTGNIPPPFDRSLHCSNIHSHWGQAWRLERLVSRFVFHSYATTTTIILGPIEKYLVFLPLSSSQLFLRIGAAADYVIRVSHS